MKKVRESAGCCWNGHLTARVAEMNKVVLEGLLVAYLSQSAETDLAGETKYKRIRKANKKMDS
jgi:hypothetical protein